MTSLLFLPLRAVLLISMALLLAACEIKTDNNVPDVPPTGLFAAVGANQNSGEDSVQVAVAIFEDGEPINLVGGDVVQASTSDDSILLLKPGFYLGSYAASLPNSSNFNQIDFLIVHDPIATRQDRWYPVDLLNNDPGPGELVGGSATITLPPEPNITNKNDIDGKVFNSVSDSLDINWAPLADGDEMIVRAAVTCDDGIKTSTYGIEVPSEAMDISDDGFESFKLDQFILDINRGSDEIKLIRGEARAMLIALIEKKTNIINVEEIFRNLKTINPLDNPCEINMFLFRQRAGNFASTDTNGRIFGSRSSEIIIKYLPLTQF